MIYDTLAGTHVYSNIKIGQKLSILPPKMKIGTKVINFRKTTICKYKIHTINNIPCAINQTLINARI